MSATAYPHVLADLYAPRPRDEVRGELDCERAARAAERAQQGDLRAMRRARAWVRLASRRLERVGGVSGAAADRLAVAVSLAEARVYTATLAITRELKREVRS